jgi:predicted TIM-barrel fold metal-dependent hydrolase
MTGNIAASEVRKRIDHPVIDADGHYIETMPILKPYLIDAVRDIAGADLAAKVESGAAGMDYDDTVLRPWSKLSWEQRRGAGISRPPWWTLPAANTLDRATAQIPRLMASRLDELGIDFAVMYPSRMLTATAIPNPELRRATCRALNRFYAEVYKPYSDRMTPVAQIPTHTPEEAIAELDYAVGVLGLKAIMINGLIHRPLPPPADMGGARPNWGATSASRIDTLGLDSEYDYDPFWRRCVELKVSPASHTPGMGWGSRQSPSSYVYNHIGSFGAAMEATCKSLFMGGVTHRFPELTFGLLEGGVGWAVTLLNDLIEHWEKRNANTIHDLDPARIDTNLMMELFETYQDDVFGPDAPGLAQSFAKLEPEPPYTDEWAACGIKRPMDIVKNFVPRFYFGCEAEDSSVAWAFNRKLNPARSKLRAMFSSDVSHWDVSDMKYVLGESWELVEHGHITEEDYRDFVFAYPAQFYSNLNKDFFKGTRIEGQVASLSQAELAAAE